MWGMENNQFSFEKIKGTMLSSEQVRLPNIYIYIVPLILIYMIIYIYIFQESSQ